MNGWLVLYTIKNLNSTGWGKDMEDRSAIFIEHNEKGLSPEEQAREFYNSLIDEIFDSEEVALYSANLCEIKESTEAHYTDIEN